MDADESLTPELQEIADLLWEHAQCAPPIELDKTWWMINAPLWEAEIKA